MINMETGKCSFACAFLHLFINVLLLVLIFLYTIYKIANYHLLLAINFLLSAMMTNYLYYYKILVLGTLVDSRNVFTWFWTS